MRAIGLGPPLLAALMLAMVSFVPAALGDPVPRPTLEVVGVAPDWMDGKQIVWSTPKTDIMAPVEDRQLAIWNTSQLKQINVAVEAPEYRGQRTMRPDRPLAYPCLARRTLWKPGSTKHA